MGDKFFGIDEMIVVLIVQEVCEVYDFGVEIIIVVGGGNIICGVVVSYCGIDCVIGDYMGMLFIVINGLVFQDVFEKVGVMMCVQIVIDICEVVEFFIWCCVIWYFEKGCCVIFVVGIGNLFFMMDSVVVLCVNEIYVEVLFKVIKVNGIYMVDLEQDFDVELLLMVIYQQVFECNFCVMDVVVISFCCDNNLLIVVFDLGGYGNICCVVCGEIVGFIVID